MKMFKESKKESFKEFAQAAGVDSEVIERVMKATAANLQEVQEQANNNWRVMPLSTVTGFGQGR